MRLGFVHSCLIGECGALKPFARGFRWNWILNRRSDLVWYIGSALIGWLYVALVFVLGRGLSDPLHEPLTTLSLGGLSLHLTLELLIFASWAYLVDSPHLWATLARTYLDPDEWQKRRHELLFSLVWFIAGPIAVLAPYGAGTLYPMRAQTMAFGGQLFFAFFRLWAYYHVVRQHWGFLQLYKRKSDDLSDPAENRADAWFFNLTMYLPLALFLTSAGQAGGGFVDVEIATGLLDDPGILDPLHRLLLALYGAALIGYVAFQWIRWRRGSFRNGPKLLFLISVVPLHYAVFASPLLALFAVPIVTVGHNLQYHRIVWMYGQNKYTRGDPIRYRYTRPVFHHLWLYLFLGYLFTFSLSRGPWVEFVGQELATTVDQWIFPAIGMMAGIVKPEAAGVGAELVALFLTGWSMHHYYLDAKIWRVSKDRQVSRSLNL